MGDNSAPNIHTLQRFAMRWTLNDVLAAYRHVARLSTQQVAAEIAPLPDGPFNTKLRLVSHIQSRHGPAMVDAVERELRGSDHLGSALGEAGYTLYQLQQDLDRVPGAESPMPQIVQQALLFVGAQTADQKELLLEQWRRRVDLLARVIITMKLQQYLDSLTHE